MGRVDVAGAMRPNRHQGASHVAIMHPMNSVEYAELEREIATGLI